MHEAAGFYENEAWTAGIVGLGYIGLPLALAACRSGLDVIGFDIDEAYIERLNDGESVIEDVSDAELRSALASRLELTADAGRLREADAIFICVPSPLGRNREPDLSYIRSAVEVVRRVAHPRMLVSLESTTYPGTTEEIVVPAVLDGRLRLDEDVWVAFSPERVSPGDQLATADIPKLVGGVTEQSTAVAAAAYRRIIASVHPVSSAAVAEMAKLLENTYRAVNIGLANEMSQLAHALGLDIWEVIDAAATKPFGFQPFYPGPGVGGHCIPLDPQFLAWRAREAKFATRFIDLAEEVNLSQPIYTARRVMSLINQQRLPVYGTEVLGVGISYKANIADDRESASLEVLHELEAQGAVISVLDPVVGEERIEAHGFTAVSMDGDLSGFAIVVVLTDHDVIDYAAIADAGPIVFDARGAYRRRGIARGNVVAL